MKSKKVVPPSDLIFTFHRNNEGEVEVVEEDRIRFEVLSQDERRALVETVERYREKHKYDLLVVKAFQAVRRREIARRKIPCPARHPDYPDVPCEWWLGHEKQDGRHSIFVSGDDDYAPELITWADPPKEKEPTCP